MKIWCPFDLEQSNFVKVLKERNYEVIYSHLNLGQDFYNYEPENWDIIISNPPFSNKTKTLQRLKSFNKNKKWVLIFGNQFFQTGSFLRELNDLNDFNIITFEKRMWFIKDYNNDIKPKSNPAFASVLLTNNLEFNKGFICIKGV